MTFPLVTTAIIAFSMAISVAAIANSRNAPVEQGTFRPSGPPDHPTRYEIDRVCIVDLEQSYEVEGTLEGTMTIDFRIFVEGPCGAPPGTYDEHWIAHGHYDLGSSRLTAARGSLAYIADVSAGGRVSGKIMLAGELQGDLRVDGRFEDGAMRYTGSIDSKVKE